MGHVTPDTWHLSPDTGYVTHDMWHMLRGWTFSQNFSSLALTVWDRECLEDSERKDDSMNEWMNELINNELLAKVFIEQAHLHRVY